MTAPDQGGVLFGPFDAPETATAPGQAAALRQELTVRFREAADVIAGCGSGKNPCEDCEGEISDVMEIADAYAEAAQERPAPASASLPPDPSADELRLAAEADEARGQLGTAWRLLDEARALLAVTAAERDKLAQALDERNAQHKQLLDGFDLVEGLADGDQHGVAVLEAAELARAYRDAGYPVRDDLSHLEA